MEWVEIGRSYEDEMQVLYKILLLFTLNCAEALTCSDSRKRYRWHTQHDDVCFEIRSEATSSISRAFLLQFVVDEPGRGRGGDIWS